MNRRQLLASFGLAAASSARGRSLGRPCPPARSGIAGSLPLFLPQSYGATGDGLTLDSPAINRAVDACTAAGGGIVYLQPGTYLSGTVMLKSNVTLYIEAGATLLGSKTLSDYTGNTGHPDGSDTSSRHLIFARDAENVTLAGTGLIDGQGASYWIINMQRKQLPPEEAWRDVAAYIHKALPRPSPMLEFHNCKNLRIEDVRIENAPGWTLRPIHCDNVFIRGISIKNDVTGSNTDGIDLTCSQNCFISDCSIDTGDDAICLKSEDPYNNNAGPIRVSKNITITNCVLTTCCNGFKVGTATRGGYENITFTNSVIYNNDVNYKARVIAGIDIAIVDGGYIDGVVISNIRMQRTHADLHPSRHPQARRQWRTWLRSRNHDRQYPRHRLDSYLQHHRPCGFPQVEDVSLSNIRIDSEEAGLAEWAAREIPELPTGYPEARMFGRLPSHGLYARHVAGLRLRNIEFHAAPAEQRSAILCR